MTENLKQSWKTVVTELDICIEWMYTLLNPKDKKEFFRIVGVIIENHTPGLVDGSVEQEKNCFTWNSKQISEFKSLAVSYYIEFENDNNTTPSTTIVYPSQPYIPNIPATDPYPWQLPQVWCQNNTGYKYNGTGHVTTTYTV